MAKDQNTFAKRARETEKKRKAEAKRVRRQKKKEQASELASAAESDVAAVDTDTVEREDIEQ